jgi:YVTN family beta-propeller protein
MKHIIAVAVLFSHPAWSNDNKQPSPIYREVAKVPIGGKGGWDYVSLDPASHRLFMSHSDRVVVIDMEKNKVIQEVTNTPGVHGIALAPDLNKAFSSNGKENKVSIIDLKTYTTRSKISVGENPDAIVYESAQHEVYVFNGRSKSASVIDAQSEKVATTIPLPGKPEFAVVDSEHHRVFVNIQDQNSLLAINTQSHAIVATWRLDGCESPSGLALDTKNQRLFSTCGNEKMVMLDATSGHLVKTIPTGEGTDGAGFDPELKLAFSPNGKSGTVTIAAEETPNELAIVQTLKTKMGARTMTLDPQTHRIYLPTAELQTGEKGARPKPVDGTQEILVYGPN